MKAQFILPVIIAASLVAFNPGTTGVSGTAPVTTAAPSVPAGLAPSSVAGKTIYVSAEAYTFDAGSNSYPYETGTVTYVKTGANTARIIDTFSGFNTDIIFTSPTKGRSTDGDVVTVE